MTLAQLRLYLQAEERRQRALQRNALVAARAAYLDKADLKRLLDDLA